MVVTEADCKAGNTTRAKRMPETDEERNSYYDWYGDYDGHFRATNFTNCTINPNCHGHYINQPCKQRAYSDAQMYWNDINLVSHGFDDGGYSDDHGIEIWYAAMTTESHVMMMWSTPTVFQGEFAGTEAAWFRVDFPESDKDCTDYHLTQPFTCTENVMDRLGQSPLGACDYPSEVSFFFTV